MLPRFSPCLLWIILSLPALAMLNGVIGSTDPEIYENLLHPSGETSARLMSVALMATPLRMLLKGWRGPQWLVKNRRYFGVAALGYAAIHTVFYLIDEGSAQQVFTEISRLYIWTGSLAFLIFTPLAITPSDYFIRKMGTHWKKLQRWTYAAAVLTLLHWAALHNWGGLVGAAVHFAPLVLLTLFRLWKRYQQNLDRAKA